MQERNHRGIDQGNGPNRRNVLVKKIGAIFTSACGSRRRAQQMRLAAGEEETERPISEEHVLALNMSRPCEQIQVEKVHAMGTQEDNCKKRCRKRHLTSSLSGIFRKSSIGFNLRKWKTVKIGSGNAYGTRGLVLKQSFGRIVRKRDVPLGKKTRTREEEKVDEAEEEAKSALELCKKRILMGEKCRPLNQSGVLHYDKEGILLPENDVPIEES